ncbi:MAG: hypothetical protein AB1473_04450 [Thermodesulfobacteriota bacterium]
MEEIDIEGRGISGASPEHGFSEETFEGERKGFDCYRRCMDDAWDLKGESVCSTVCGV